MSTSGGGVAAALNLAQKLGYAALSEDVGQAPSSSNYTVGRVFVGPMTVDNPIACQTMYCATVTTPGVGLANCFIGVYDANLNLLATSGDISAALQTATPFLIATALNQIIPKQALNAKLYWAYLVGAATTQPAMVANQFVATAPPSGPLVFESNATSLTALPASLASAVTAFSARVPFMAIGP